MVVRVLRGELLAKVPLSSPIFLLRTAHAHFPLFPPKSKLRLGETRCSISPSRSESSSPQRQHLVEPLGNEGWIQFGMIIGRNWRIEEEEKEEAFFSVQ